MNRKDRRLRMGEEMDKEHYETMSFEVRLAPQGDYNSAVSELVSQLRAGLWVKPAHQRGLVWPERKKRGWIERLASPVRPIGAIATYQIVNGESGPVFLNDGQQRIMACLEFLESPEQYGFNPGEAEDICRNCRLPVQHRHYESHDVAYLDFQRVNQGMSLTGLEFYKGVFAYMPGYDGHWKTKLEELHQETRECSARIVSRQSRNRPSKHKYARHDYVLAYRLLARDKDLTRVDVGKADCSNERLEKRDVIEWFLRGEFGRRDRAEIDRDLENLHKLINRETDLIRVLWDEAQKEHAITRGLSMTLYRFLIEMSIWKRNNKIPNTEWEKYVKAMLANTAGTSFVIDPDDGHKLQALGLGRMDLIKKTCDHTGVDLISIAERRRGRRDPQAYPGLDQSHIEPFATNGDGTTILEPASRNRARGAKPIAPKSS